MRRAHPLLRLLLLLVAHCAPAPGQEPPEGAMGSTLEAQDFAASTCEFIRATPGSLDFGVQRVGTQSAPRPVTVENCSSTRLTLSAETAFPFQVSLPYAPLRLDPQETAELLVTFMPQDMEYSTGTLSLTSDAAPPGSDILLPLSGTGGQPRALLDWNNQGECLYSSARCLFFITPPATVASNSVILTNGGNLPLSFKSVALEGNDAKHFALVPPKLPMTLAPGDSAKVGVEFHAAEAGDYLTNMVFESDDPQAPASRVPLEGYTSEVDLSPWTLDFGKVLAGYPSKLRQVKVINYFFGSTVYWIAIEGEGAAQFSLVNPPQVPFFIEKEQPLTLYVHFIPSASGDVTARLALYLDGLRTAPVRMTLRGSGVPTVLSLSAPSLELGETEVDTPISGHLILTNVSSQPIVLAEPKLHPAEPFTVELSQPFDDSSGKPLRELNPGETRLLKVRYLPHAPGNSAATLTLDTIDPPMSQAAKAELSARAHSATGVGLDGGGYSCSSAGRGSMALGLLVLALAWGGRFVTRGSRVAPF